MARGNVKNSFIVKNVKFFLENLDRMSSGLKRRGTIQLIYSHFKSLISDGTGVHHCLWKGNINTTSPQW